MMGGYRFKLRTLIQGWCFFIHKIILSIVPRVFVFTAMIMTTACTTAPLEDPQELSFNKILVDNANAPELSLAIINKPGKNSDYINPFKSYNLLVLSIKLKNTTRDLLLIDRSDLTLTALNGRTYSPISERAALARATGPIGRLVPKVETGYHLYAFSDKTLVRSGESTVGYLFYQVGKKHYNDAINGSLRFALYRIRKGESTEYRFHLSDGVE